MKKRYQINILGQELSVLSDADDEHVARVVEYVDRRAREIKESNNTFNSLTLAILTALNIADEYLKNMKDAYDLLGRRTERLIDLIDGHNHIPVSYTHL
ncbi:MAG: cell division protein ZapA, partial [Syntrophales bacterium]|nr:cell division protein ZapA [Syntrophales bacterium]